MGSFSDARGSFPPGNQEVQHIRRIDFQAGKSTQNFHHHNDTYEIWREQKKTVPICITEDRAMATNFKWVYGIAALFMIHDRVR